MIDTHKLIYILPEVAYVAELLPAKKQHSFAIHNFRQINGEFIKDDEFIAESIVKLFSKLDKETYHIIIPDSLCTNTILTISETSETKIKNYIKDELLPSLDLTQETHVIETFVLTQFKGISKVQLSAVEKSLLSPIRAAATQFEIKISGVSPLSWTIKSIVSLEPSISVLQIGSMVYTAIQYIGVDQATIASLDELDQVSETIKTLKGSEPSIQTIYLLANEVVEENLKESLSSILPIQQLASFSEEVTQMPSYVKQIIESGMKTLAIADYSVPKFELGKATAEELSQFVAGKLDISDDDDSTEEVSPELPAPTPAPLLPPATPEPILESGTDQLTLEPEAESVAKENPTALEKNDDIIQDDTEESDTSSKELPDESETKQETVTTTQEASDDDIVSTIEPETAVNDPEPILQNPEINTLNQDVGIAEPKETLETPVVAAATIAAEPAIQSSVASKASVDLSQFTQGTSVNTQPTTQVPIEKPVIKNKSGIQNMLKMFVVTVLVFVITVAVGVGVGLGILTLTNKSTNSEVATLSASPSPAAIAEPSPSPSPSPTVEIVKADLKILIVNATTKAGYAGTYKTRLDAADYGTVATTNAKGDYEAGLFVLMEEENTALVETLATDSELELTYLSEGYSTEDANGTYDAVIVLAE